MNNSGRIIAAGVVFFGGLLVGLYVIVSVLTRLQFLALARTINGK